tara:strand:+ start:372 stop:485 length:114 start_codon:yes stop_codon:yes gene_type:complete
MSRLEQAGENSTVSPFFAIDKVLSNAVSKSITLLQVE